MTAETNSGSDPYSKLKDLSILVVDDEEDLRALIASELEFHGSRVTQSANGKEALETLQHESFRVVISDVKMPGLSGIQLLERIRAKDSKEPAVILVSGFADIDTTDAIAKGAVGLLSKPFDMQELVDFIARIA